MRGRNVKISGISSWRPVADLGPVMEILRPFLKSNRKKLVAHLNFDVTPYFLPFFYQLSRLDANRDLPDSIFNYNTFQDKIS